MYGGSLNMVSMGVLRPLPILVQGNTTPGILGSLKVGQDGDMGLGNSALFKQSHLLLSTGLFVPASFPVFFPNGFFSSLQHPQRRLLFTLYLRGSCLHKAPGIPHSVSVIPPGAPELSIFPNTAQWPHACALVSFPSKLWDSPKPVSEPQQFAQCLEHTSHPTSYF